MAQEDQATPKTKYEVLKEVTAALEGAGGVEITFFVPVGSATTHGPKQAIKAVAADVETLEGVPGSNRLGPYRATPAGSWHAHQVTEKPAELAVD